MQVLQYPGYFSPARLTDYAVFFRYPGDEEPLNEQDYNVALHIASDVVKWAEAIINGSVSCNP